MAKKGINIFVGINDSNFQKGIKRINRTLGKVGKTMTNAGRSMTRNLTMPMALAGAASVKMAVELQTSLTKISTLVGASTEDLKGYEAAIRSISSTTATGQKELAEGLFFITSAGFEGEKALEALRVSAKGSAMGMGEMQDIATAVTSIMTGYADSNMTATQAGDLLHETLKQGKFEASEFMSSVGQVIPTAVAAGVSFEELGAATATLSKLSGDAKGSLTAINSVMMKLLTPGQQQKDILKSVGLSYDELQSMLGDSLMGTLQHLFTALEGNNEQLVKVFGSSRAVKAAFGTMGAQAETYSNVLDGMNQSQGNVEQGFQRVSQTAGFQLKQAFEDVKNAGIELGAMLLPVVLKIVGVFKRWVTSFQKLTPEGQKLAVVIGLVVAALGPMATILGGIVTAFSLITLPILKTTLLIIGLVAAFIYLRENWEAVKERLGDWAFIKNAIISTFQFFIKYNLWSLVIEGFNKLRAYLNKDPLPNPFEKIADSMDDLKEEQKEYKNEFGSFADAIKNQSAEAAKALGLLGDNIGIGGGGVVGGKSSENKNNDNLVGPPPPPDFSDYEPPKDLPSKWENVFEKMKAGWNAWGDTATQRMQNVLGVFSQIGQQIAQITAMNFQNRLAELDQQEQKEIESIENSKRTEEEKEKAIQGIQEKYAVQRKKIERQAAIQKKKAGVFQALVNTGMAITNALANIPAPFNIPVAATMGVLGMAQVAAIQSQPLPALAEGGLAFGPTSALVGDNPGAQADPEVIAPLSKLQNMMGGGQRVMVEGIIRGSDIYLVNRDQTKQAIRAGDVTINNSGSLNWQ